MKVALATHWRCLTCGASGQYDWADYAHRKTDSPLPDAKHLSGTAHEEKCTGVVVSAMQAGVLEILRAGSAG